MNIKLRKPRAGSASARVGATAAAARWEAIKHPRGPGGRFRETADAEKPATTTTRAPAQRKPTVGETALKTSGVGRDDEISVLSSRVRAYANSKTVGDFVDSHPKGRAYALRKLAADHKKGVIGFKGKAEAPAAGPANPASEPRPAAFARKDGAWNGAAARRDISGDEVVISPQATRAGLMKSEAEFRQASEAMLAGIPKQERLRVVWAEGAKGSLIMTAANDKGTVRITRNFYPSENGWTVRHTMFALPKKYQGGGNARAMLRSSVEQYDRMGVARIEAHANINVGGYAWARLGFAADSPAEIRQAIGKAVGKAPRSAKGRVAKEIMATSSDDDLMFNLARATGPDGERLGRRLLGPKASWSGHLDLKNARHRERLNESFA
ncbi:hypothetical protein [Methylobacterium indicum]|uniref:N-acetyltransferase domain-containing protein n=1 Tax=Methylobacterium indicum TaxID=1775910 RepID=A0ABR5HFN7_9HYPH|nr:hypothetical protein [Methylobacterium indicum]KMO18900.1 hypothetical protein QR78_14420 [Methylobacterium indicum]KMO25058.1 hypothetical protein QR79_09810 [Methylobacterium indicum]